MSKNLFVLFYSLLSKINNPSALLPYRGAEIKLLLTLSRFGIDTYEFTFTESRFIKTY